MCIRNVRRWCRCFQIKKKVKGLRPWNKKDLQKGKWESILLCIVEMKSINKKNEYFICLSNGGGVSKPISE